MGVLLMTASGTGTHFNARSKGPFALHRPGSNERRGREGTLTQVALSHRQKAVKSWQGPDGGAGTTNV